jgi:hypothetical protein
MIGQRFTVSLSVYILAAVAFAASGWLPGVVAIAAEPHHRQLNPEILGNSTVAALR